MSGVTESFLFWLTLLCFVHFAAIAESNGPKCINGAWKDGECVCSLGYKTVHEVEDVTGGLQPVYCNTTVQIVIGAYQWTEQDVLQLVAADLAVVLATVSCLALIHLFVFLVRLIVAARKLDKLKLSEKAFLNYISTYHQEKQLLPTLWTPPSTFQLLSAHETKREKGELSQHITESHQSTIETKREKGKNVTEPHQSSSEESDTETLQTRFNLTLEQEQSDVTQPQEDTTLTLWQSHYSSTAEIEEATVTNETGTDGKVNASEPWRKALEQSKVCSQERLEMPENMRGRGDRSGCSMDTDSQKKSQRTKKTKRSKGDKKPTRRSKPKGRDVQDTREAGEKRKKKSKERLLAESSSNQFSA